MSPRQSPVVVDRLEDRRYGLRGELSFATAAASLSVVLCALRDLKGGAVEIELTEVRNADSAGLALLIELVRWAKQQDIRLHFSHLSQQLESLAAVSGVDGLLPRGS